MPNIEDKLDKYLTNESLVGWGKKGTIQTFGNDVVVTDAKNRSIQLTKPEVCDLLKVLKCMK